MTTETTTYMEEDNDIESQPEKLDLFSLDPDDAMKLLVCDSHIGTNGADFQCKNYVWTRRADGTHIFDIKKMWDKLYLAARAIAAVEDPADVCIVSGEPKAQRALLKFAAHTGATPIVGRFTPGSLTNHIQKKNFKEPRLLVISDPRIDHQAVAEASYVNMPVIGFCNSDSPLKFIDIAVPCNNKEPNSIGLMWWMLAREVLVLRGKINRKKGFKLAGQLIMPDLYFHREIAEQEEKEKEKEKEVGLELDRTEDPEPADEHAPEGMDAEPVPEPKPAPAPQPTSFFSGLNFAVQNIDDWAVPSDFEKKDGKGTW